MVFSTRKSAPLYMHACATQEEEEEEDFPLANSLSAVARRRLRGEISQTRVCLGGEKRNSNDHG